MDIITLLGSPRRHGNTAAVLSAFEAQVTPRHSIQRINVVDHTIHGCLGCDYCQRHPASPLCAQKDEANAIFERMMRADLLVYATPLYAWDFTAQMKALLDRHYCLTKWNGDQVDRSFLEGKHVMLLVTCGGAIENNADVIQIVFRREMECARCNITGIHILPGCSTPREIGERLTPLVESMVSEVAAVEEGSQV